jgi:hypothetical protein
MKPITSIADLFIKMKSDGRYHHLLIQAADYYTYPHGDYNNSVNWVKKWCDKYVTSINKPNNDYTYDTCGNLVECFNSHIPRLVKKYPDPIPPVVI